MRMHSRRGAAARQKVKADDYQNRRILSSDTGSIRSVTCKPPVVKAPDHWQPLLDTEICRSYLHFMTLHCNRATVSLSENVLLV